MLIRRIALQGFTTYERRAALDFDDVPDGSVIAVVGPTGAGKTTLVELMGPGALYRYCPASASSLKDLVSKEILLRAGRKEAALELTVEYDGQVYEHLIRVDPFFGGGAGKEMAFLYRGADRQPLATGKVTDYDQAILKLYPPSEVFLASAFSAQQTRYGKPEKAGNFMTMGQGSRKDLFAYLLGLSDLQTISDRSREHRKLVLDRTGRLEKSLTDLASRRVFLQTLEDDLETARLDFATAAGQVTSLQRIHDDYQHALSQIKAELDGADKARETALKQRQGLETDLQAAEARLSTTAGQIQRGEALVARGTQIRGKVTALADREMEKRMLEEALREVNRELAAGSRRQTELNNRRGQVEPSLNAARKRHELQLEVQTRLPGLELEATQGQEATQEAEALAQQVQIDQNAMNRLERELATAEANARSWIASAESNLSAARDNAALLAGVPCKGATLATLGTHDDFIHQEGAEFIDGHVDCSNCQFLTTAQDGQSRIDQLEQVLANAREDLAGVEARKGQARTQGEDLKALQQRQAARRDEGKRLATRQNELIQARALLSDLEETTARVTALEQELQQIGFDLSDCGRELVEGRKKSTTVQTQMDRINTAILNDLNGAAEELRLLEAAEARLPDLRETQESLAQTIGRTRAALKAMVVPEAADALRDRFETQQTALQGAQKGLQAAREDHARLQRAIGQIEGQLEARRSDLPDEGVMRNKLEGLQARAGACSLLHKAFGRDGIQALELDAAGPGVSSLITDLLAACYGDRFGVTMRTLQEAEGSRVQKEVFDFEIYDARDSTTKLAAKLSGGEQVIFDTALRLSMTIYNSRRHSGRLETLWLDESSNGLDESLRGSYTGMIRRAMALGGFRRCFLVSHNREIWQQADMRLKVQAGTLELE